MSGAAGVRQVLVRQGGSLTAVIGRGADMADAAVIARLEVAGEIVVSERQAGQRGNVDRDEDLEEHA